MDDEEKQFRASNIKRPLPRAPTEDAAEPETQPNDSEKTTAAVNLAACHLEAPDNGKPDENELVSFYLSYTRGGDCIYSKYSLNTL